MGAAGPLRDLIAFDRRREIDDGFGNKEADFVEVFQTAAQTTPLKATESVIASKLTGIQPWTVTIRYSVQSIQIDTNWRARDVRSGAVYDIVSFAPRSRRDYIDLICTSGKAA